MNLPLHLESRSLFILPFDGCLTLTGTTKNTDRND